MIRHGMIGKALRDALLVSPARPTLHAAGTYGQIATWLIGVVAEIDEALGGRHRKKPEAAKPEEKTGGAP